MRVAVVNLPGPPPLEDALVICLLLLDQEPDRYERAAVRWLGRLLLEQRGVSLRKAEVAATYLAAWPDPARRDAATEALGNSDVPWDYGVWRRASPALATTDRPAETTGPARTLTGRMCGRYTYTTRRSDEIHAKLADTLSVEGPASDHGFERFNIAPTQEVLAVVDDRHGRRIEQPRWGLVPHWAKELNTRFSMINARAETLHQRPTYSSLVRQAEHRCLILADGYYEWQWPEDPKQPRQPVHFSLDGNQPFCFAGLWTRWRPPGGEVVSSCAIVTCPANAFTRPIHDRMPVILADPEAWECWLNPAVDGDAARELLVPLSSKRMVARPANPILNSPRHEGPDCLAALRRIENPPRPCALDSRARSLGPAFHRSAGRSRTAAQLGLFHDVPSRR